MYKIDVASKDLIRMESTNFCKENLRERYDIQEWVEKNPSILGEDLLIIGKEVKLPSNIRIDLLALDKSSNLVIVELKRDDSGNSVDWQAIKYASYCSSYTNLEIFAQYAEYLGTTHDEAENQIREFIESETFEDLNNFQRIILVSREFHSDVASAVLWLRDFGVDIACVRLNLYVDNTQNLFIVPIKIIPLPEAEDYLIKKEKKQKETRRANIGSFSLDESNYDSLKLKAELKSSLIKQTDLIPRLIVFLRILLSEERAYNREELKGKLYENGVSNDIGRAGAHLSNISQFLTKKANSHFRQIISFDTGGGAGDKKDNYIIKNDYRELLKNVLDEVESDS